MKTTAKDKWLQRVISILPTSPEAVPISPTGESGKPQVRRLYFLPTGLAFKLSLFILFATSTIFVFAFLYGYTTSRQIVLGMERKNVGNLAQATVHKIESVLFGVESPPRYLAAILEDYHGDRDRLMRLVEEMVRTQEVIFGSTTAFEPYAFDPDVYDFAPYFYRDGETIHSVYLDGHDYNYFIWDWYQVPKLLEDDVWSEPYFDEGGGGVLMATYSVPFFRLDAGEREFRGVVTADISLEWLVDLISSLTYLESGYAFLISQNGVFVTHPDSSFIMRESIFSVAEAHGSSALREIGRSMIHGEEGFTPINDTLYDQRAWLYFAPLPSAGWSLGIVIPEVEVFAAIGSLNRQIMLIGLVGIVLLILVVILIASRVTQPLRALALTTTEIAKGNLDIHVPDLHTHDEISELSHSFENMRSALKEYIVNLQETTAAKERIESELKIARSIQMNFLPKHFPPFPDKQEFDLYAMLRPAKEVGGDLYDFFLLDDDHLFISVGDVADKGVPAALFMAVTKTLMKGIAEQGVSPSEVLTRVNNELAQENESAMFVTVFCGVLNMKTGEFVYSNAGHNPPALIRSGEKPEWLELPPGFLLGPIAGTEYIDASVTMRPGDKIVAYTDGVNESFNPSGEMFGNDRLLDVLQSRQQQDIHPIVEGLFHSVEDHAQDEPQSDDITILGLHYRGAQAAPRKRDR